MADFVHLHCHSQYSLRDGVASVEELVCAAKKANMPAIALTDHGNMFGLIPFYKECKKKCEKECEKECNRTPITPIIGVEAYIAIFNRFVKSLDPVYPLDGGVFVTVPMYNLFWEGFSTKQSFHVLACNFEGLYSSGGVTDRG